MRTNVTVLFVNGLSQNYDCRSVLVKEREYVLTFVKEGNGKPKTIRLPMTNVLELTEYGAR